MLETDGCRSVEDDARGVCATPQSGGGGVAEGKYAVGEDAQVAGGEVPQNAGGAHLYNFVAFVMVQGVDVEKRADRLGHCEAMSAEALTFCEGGGTSKQFHENT